MIMLHADSQTPTDAAAAPATPGNRQTAAPATPGNNTTNPAAAPATPGDNTVPGESRAF